MSLVMVKEIGFLQGKSYINHGEISNFASLAKKNTLTDKENSDLVATASKIYSIYEILLDVAAEALQAENYSQDQIPELLQTAYIQRWQEALINENHALNEDEYQFIEQQSAYALEALNVFKKLANWPGHPMFASCDFTKFLTVYSEEYFKHPKVQELLENNPMEFEDVKDMYNDDSYWDDLKQGYPYSF